MNALPARPLTPRARPARWLGVIQGTNFVLHQPFNLLLVVLALITAELTWRMVCPG